VDSNDVRREWAERSGEYSPTYYAHYGADETSESVADILTEHVGREASVLELGSSSGRHLEYLRESGFDDLSGIELNEDAFDVMAEQYPALDRSGTFYADSIENAVEDFADDAFDVVYSVQTLQHIHPDSGWVFEEVARIAGELLVTVECESPEADAEREECEDGPDRNYVRDEFPLYYRDWADIFTNLGFDQVVRRDGRRDTIRAFRSR
jgi:SAM-dependent methyltransferase